MCVEINFIPEGNGSKRNEFSDDFSSLKNEGDESEGLMPINSFYLNVVVDVTKQSPAARKGLRPPLLAMTRRINNKYIFKLRSRSEFLLLFPSILFHLPVSILIRNYSVQKP
jgi:hypothetical protein